jgi:hypothetical protein
MSNERTPGAPLTATVREELERKQHEGEPSGLDLAERAVADLEAGARGRRAGEDRDRGPQAEGAAARPERRAPAGRAGLGWAIAAGLGTFALIGMARRAFGR